MCCEGELVNVGKDIQCVLGGRVSVYWEGGLVCVGREGSCVLEGRASVYRESQCVASVC